MFKEYKTIREVVGPLMMVDGVEGVTYNELVDIVCRDGSIRRGKVLEVNRDRRWYSFSKIRKGCKFRPQRRVSPVTASNSRVRAICSAECSTAWATPATAARPSYPIKFSISTASR